MIYNEFRPIIFDEIRGQDVSVTIAKNQVINDTANAFLFVGTHGTGKTTLAKIFARSKNCENLQDGNPCNECPSCREYFESKNMDIAEIDGASNNSIDDIRKIKDQLIYYPRRKKKVYIIDEAHMLSTAAFNALLTTLEEPPKYVVFILCTTEVNKIPATIRSRCLRLDFQRISDDEIFKNMVSICKKKGYGYENDGLRLIASIANGSMRDALSILEKCISYGELTYLNISDVIGIVDIHSVVDIVKSIIKKQPIKAIDNIYELYRKGKDMIQLTNDIIKIFRNIMILQSTDDASLFDMDILCLTGIKLSGEYCYMAINEFSKLLVALKNTDNQKVLMDIYILQVSKMLQGKVNETVIEENSSSQNKTTEDKKAVEPNQKVENVNQDKTAKEVVNEPTKESLKESQEQPINHNDYLLLKIDLIRSYGVNSEEVSTLINSQIFTRKDAFIIKTSKPDKLNLDDIKLKLKELSGKDLNVFIKTA